MGYRSNVRIVVSKEGYEFLKKYVAEESKENECVDLLDFATIKPYEINDVSITWNYIKWHICFTEVSIVETGLGYMEKENLSYGFCRIGEDETDIERYSFEGKDKINCYIDVTRDFYEEKPSVQEKLSFAKNQSFLNFVKGNTKDVPFIDFGETEIVCPWIDKTGRFDLSDTDAVETYGLANIMKFVDEIWDRFGGKQ